MNVDIQGLKNKQIPFIMFSIFVISMLLKHLQHKN